MTTRITRALATLCLSIAAMVVAIVPGTARAFHAGQSFSDPPGAGGGGGLFYLGTPKERGWDCTMCHEGAPKRIRLRLVSDPPELFESFQFQPGIRYGITATMEFDAGEDELGAGSPGNTNAMSATFEDDAGVASGLATGTADDWTVTNGATLTSKGTKSGLRSFKFNWFAPDAATAGPTTLWLGLVDGNGGAATDTFQDPLGDDVLMTHVRFTPVGGAPTAQGASASGGTRRLSEGPGSARRDASTQASTRSAPARTEAAPPTLTIVMTGSCVALATLLMWGLCFWRKKGHMGDQLGRYRGLLFGAGGIALVALVAAACDDAANTSSSSTGCPAQTICGDGGAGSTGNTTGSMTTTGGMTTTNSTGSGACVEDWECGPWSTNGTDDAGSRVCVDLNGCGTSTSKPVTTATLPQLDLNYYKCKVEPILDKGCAMMGCHGSDSRGLRTYSRGRYRLAGEMVTAACGGPPQTTDLKNCIGSIECACYIAPHTTNEWRRNFDSARGLLLDAAGQPLADSEQSELIQQPMEGTGKAHAGFKLFKSTDAEHATLKAWLDKQTLASCNTTN